MFHNSCVECGESPFLVIDLRKGIEHACIFVFGRFVGGVSKLPLDLQAGCYEFEGVDGKVRDRGAG